jgi:hypothetical protein
MSTRRGVLTALSLGALAGGALALVRVSSPVPAQAKRADEIAIDRREVVGPAPRPDRAPAPPADPEALRARLADARWLAVGGGAWPEATQVQIEQDVGLAAQVFGDGGVVLFGAGPDAPVVQVQHDLPRDPLGTALAELFAPRGGRDASYRAPAIPVDAEATAAGVLEALGTATAAPGAPLLVFLAGHGDIGETPRDNSVSLWAASRIGVGELAQTLDGARRPVRLVVTTCFSGGFAELAFADADEAAGAAGDRCGLFASTWDLEASGCDPNPDRSAQQGYAIHFLNALRQRDREGAPLPLAELDLDGDGRVGLLDAHTRVRIASDGADVPTTTSERWLRAHAPTSGPEVALELPEEDAVVAALGPRLGIAGDAAGTRLASIEAEIAAADAEVERTTGLEDAAFRLAAAELLARWPVLDDPWHPEFATTFRGQRPQIEEFLRASARYAEYLEAREAAAIAHGRRADLTATAAPVERLARAIENQEQARRLAGQGGAAFETWQRLRACERWSPTPGLRGPSGP